MEPVTVTATIVSIAVPALHGVRLLWDDLQKIIDAPKAVEDLKEDLLSVDMAIQSLQELKDPEWESLGKIVVDGSKAAISSCSRACDKFKAYLQRWTRHSEDGRLSWKDRAIVGFFKQHQIKSTSEQLQNCKITLNSVVSIATLHSSIRNARITQETKQAISAKEGEITRAIKATEKQMAEVKSRLGELDLASHVQDEEVEGTEYKAGVLQEIDEEQTALSASRKVLEELLSKTRHETTVIAAKESQNHSSNVTTYGDNYGLQMRDNYAPMSGFKFGGKG